jgi:hypothetical protein
MGVWVDIPDQWVQLVPQWIDFSLGIGNAFSIALQDFEEYTDEVSHLQAYARAIVDQASYFSFLEDAATLARTISETPSMPASVLKDIETITDQITVLVSNPNPHSKSILINDIASYEDS